MRKFFCGYLFRMLKTFNFVELMHALRMQGSCRKLDKAALYFRLPQIFISTACILYKPRVIREIPELVWPFKDYLVQSWDPQSFSLCMECQQIFIDSIKAAQEPINLCFLHQLALDIYLYTSTQHLQKHCNDIRKWRFQMHLYGDQLFVSNLILANKRTSVL